MMMPGFNISWHYTDQNSVAKAEDDAEYIYKRDPNTLPFVRFTNMIMYGNLDENTFGGL